MSTKSNSPDAPDDGTEATDLFELVADVLDLTAGDAHADRRRCLQSERGDVGDGLDAQQLLVLHSPQPRSDRPFRHVQLGGDPPVAAARVSLQRVDDPQIELVDDAGRHRWLW